MGITVVPHPGHSGGRVVASHCDFNLYFPGDYDDQHFDMDVPAVYMLCFGISV